VAEEKVGVRCVAALGVLLQKRSGEQVADARSKIDIGPQFALKVPVGFLPYIGGKGAASWCFHNYAARGVVKPVVAAGQSERMVIEVEPQPAQGFDFGARAQMPEVAPPEQIGDAEDAVSGGVEWVESVYFAGCVRPFTAGVSVFG
jgi:hypothetical protein